MSTRTSKSRAEVNATILKSLLKLPVRQRYILNNECGCLLYQGNKYCCDCKTADHPRWASWNLGIFLCIRCSGIHRSMGTHISRVKSVDLDAWTDEQTQSMVSWGNKKANSYWEGKLDEAHVPSESKIDNFVKTKYVSRRWTSQETRPDPDDLEDDDTAAASTPVPQATKAPQHSTRTSDSAGLRAPPAASASTAAAPPRTRPAAASRPVDSLLGMDFGSTQISQQTATTRAEPIAPLAAQNTAQSNLSLLSDTSSSIPPQQSQQSQGSTSRTTATNPRNDLKMSIMSLYASAPKPQQYAQPQQVQTQRQAPSGNTMQKSGNAFDDLNGLFGGMNVQAATQRIPSSSLNPSSVMPAQSAQRTSSSQFNTTSSLSSNTASANPWNTTSKDDDAWGNFQGESNSKPAPTQSSAFDSLYSTSDVWK